MVVAYEIQRGTRFQILAVGTQIDEKIDLPFNDFQEEAERRVAAEWPKLVRILRQAADQGPQSLGDKSKSLEGYDDLFEFRTKGGLRLFWFYDEARVVICANGFIKQGQKTPKPELKEAAGWQHKYATAKKDKTLKLLPR